MSRKGLNLLLVIALCVGFGLACKMGGENRNENGGGGNAGTKQAAKLPRKVDGYTLRGLTFSYYLIPAGLSRDDLVKTAQEIHVSEPEAQLILVDDESGVADYVAYAKGMSQGNQDVKLPKEWADKHIVANLQRLMSGKWMLYEGYGYKEIGEIK